MPLPKGSSYGPYKTYREPIPDPTKGIGTVPLTRESEALVDLADLPLVEGRNWNAVPRWSGGSGFYAASTMMFNGQRRRVWMHRLILKARSDETIDHVDGNGLNNRRSNLRRCEAFQNSANRPFQANRNGHTGILKVASGRFVGRIKTRGLSLSKTFDTIEEAIAWRNQNGRLIFGEFFREDV